MPDNGKSKSGYSSFKHIVKDFLQIKDSREFLIFLFFLLIAFCFWYTITLRYEYETEYTVKLRLVNVPDKLIVIEPLPDEIELVLKDKGDRLIEYKTRDKLKRLNVDFRSYPNVAGHTAIYGKELHKLLSTQLVNSTQIVSVSVDTLQYYVASAEGVRLPVRLNGVVSADPQYAINRMSFDVDSVTVYAATAITDTMHGAYTQPVSFVGLTDSIYERLRIGNGFPGVKYDPEYVDLHVAVSPYVTKVVEIPVKGYMFPYGTSLRTFPSKVKVSFRIALEHFRQVDEEDFTVDVHYNRVKNHPSGKIPLRVTSSSDYVSNISVDPTEVDYLLEMSVF